MKSTLRYLPLLLLFLFSCKDEDIQPQLPPATQTGEDTFGAYVNGEVWVPKGRPSTFRSNLNIIYDPGYEGGNLEMKAYRILDTYEESIFMYMSNLDHEGLYEFGKPEIGSAIFRSDCIYERKEDVFRKGTLEITRLDMEAGIISGKFEFTLAMADCDTIRVTEGRFDYQL